VGDVVRIAETMDDAENEPAKPISDLGQRIVTPLVQSLQQELMQRLDGITIEDLCRRARAEGVAADEAPVTADFTI
jgi:Rrf2 family iron-sulfur cluster assembly transcriptional regulator